jgi:hypothetical protein
MSNRRGKRKASIKFNDILSIESVLQEVYLESCDNMNDIQNAIAELKGATPNDVDDYVKLAKAKTDFIKEKSHNLKLKLEITRLQNDSIKHSGDVKANLADTSGSSVSLEDYSSIRKLIREKNEGGNKSGE